MTGYLEDYNGNVYKLPQLTGWELSYGMGEPCDAFEVEFLYEPSMREMLHAAVRFRAEHEGETVFYGVVDEFEAVAGPDGRKVSVRGRSMAALLLDNEAEAAEYYGATLRFILEKHVIPYGVDRIEYGGGIKAADFTVASGASQWGVLRDFCRYCGGTQPRFSRDGRLLLTGEEGARREINCPVATWEQTWKETRYGVVSSVLVKNRALGLNTLVENSDFIRRGGSCRRVVNVPRKKLYDAMRYTGEYQIAESEKGSVCCTLLLPYAFAAFPADIVELEWSPLEVHGEMKVTQAVCRTSDGRVETLLTLENRQER